MYKEYHYDILEEREYILMKRSKSHKVFSTKKINQIAKLLEQRRFNSIKNKTITNSVVYGLGDIMATKSYHSESSIHKVDEEDDDMEIYDRNVKSF